MMSKAAAFDVVRDLAAGLPPDDGGVNRLLERISVHAQAELLRDVLVELGARAVLDEPDVGAAGRTWAPPPARTGPR